MTRVCTKVTVAVLAILFAISVPCATGEVIDRIVVTVNGHIILQSDLDEALCYEALLNGRTPAELRDEDRRTVLDRLIDQELLGEQMNSSFFQHATESEAENRVAEAKKQYPEAATAEGWRDLLNRYRLTEKDLIAHVRQQIDLMRVVDSHLRPAVSIDSKSIEAYYHDKFVPQLKETGTEDVPLAAVSGKIRELLTQEKVNELMVSWLQTLRSESKVTVPSAAASAEGVRAQ